MPKPRKTPSRTKAEEIVLGSMKKDLYSLLLTVGKEKYESSGETMLEALERLPKPETVFLLGTLTVSHGENKRERLLNVREVRRLFFPIAKGVTASNLALGL